MKKPIPKRNSIKTRYGIEIRLDEKQYILEEVKEYADGKNTGELYYTTLGYYSSFRMALGGLYAEVLRRKLQEYNGELQGALRLCQTLSDEITALAKEFTL